MSRYGNVYVGAYLKITKSPSIGKEIQKYRCDSCDKQKVNVTFCPDCGTKIIVETLTINERVNSFNIMESIDYRLAEVEDSFVIPNKMSRCGNHIDIDDSGEHGIPEDSINIFKSTFSNEIAIIADNGFEFEIKEGVIIYYS